MVIGIPCTWASVPVNPAAELGPISEYSEVPMNLSVEPISEFEVASNKIPLFSSTFTVKNWSYEFQNVLLK